MTGILLIMLAASLWAADTLIRYPLLENNSTLQIVFYEHLILIVIIAVLMFLVPKWRLRIKRQYLLAFVVIGVLGSAIGTLAFTKAFSLMNPTLVILLQKLQPFVAVLLSVVLLKEKLQPKFVLWALFSLAGSLVMIAPDIIALAGGYWYYKPETLAILLGYGAALLAAVAWGASTVFGRQLSLKGLNSVQIMGGRFGFGFITLLLLMLIYGESFSLSVGSTSKLTVMVLMSGLLGMWLYYQGLKRVPARLGTLGELFFPVAAVVINWIWLDAALTPLQIIGSLMLIGGSLMATRHVQEEAPSEQLALG